ncbi:MAG: hypothetical protein IJ272_01890 [Clostridia bacterium]|nr:hypothetical protein [Clostridia bacterium]
MKGFKVVFIVNGKLEGIYIEARTQNNALKKAEKLGYNLSYLYEIVEL